MSPGSASLGSGRGTESLSRDQRGTSHGEERWGRQHGGDRDTGSVGLGAGYNGTALRVPEPDVETTQAGHKPRPLVWTSHQHTVGQDRHRQTCTEYARSWKGDTRMHGIGQVLEGRHQDPTRSRVHVHTNTLTQVHRSPTDTQGTGREGHRQQAGRPEQRGDTPPGCTHVEPKRKPTGRRGGGRPEHANMCWCVGTG